MELHAEQLHGVLDRAKLDSVIHDEPVSIFHVVAAARRQRQQHIASLTAEDGTVHTEQEEIGNMFYTTYRDKFSRPAAGGGSSRILEELDKSISTEDNVKLTQPITAEEVAAAIKKSPKHKSPGEDGLTAEFYQRMWSVVGEDLTAVFKFMWESSSIPCTITKGVIVMVPKVTQPKVIKDYRPITLLDVDLKIFSRVLATRLTRVLNRLLHPNQVRPGGGRTMTGALCDLRDLISAFDTTRDPGCILSVDFSGAFDNVNHDFMFQTLMRRGLDPHFVAVLQDTYSAATSRIRVNGELTPSFPIHRSVRQGCPLSAILFAVTLSPLMFSLERRLRGYPLIRCCLKTSAYADDAFAVLRNKAEVKMTTQCFDEFSAGSGLAVNAKKSAVLAVGSWDVTVDMPYPYVTELKVLGVVFGRDIKTTIKLNWPRVVQVVKGTLSRNNVRHLNLKQRALFVNMFALSKLWHVAQVLPIRKMDVKAIKTAISYFLWKGSLFSLPIDVCCSPKSEGGLGLPDIHLRCNAMFAVRWQSLLFTDSDSFASEWLDTLLGAVPVGNPPNIPAVWAGAPHYQQLLSIRAYCAAPHLTTTGRATMRELYRVQVEAADRPTPRVVRKFPTTNWKQVWANLQSPALDEAAREAWFIAVHDLVGTRARLHSCGRDVADLCPHCQEADDLEHRLTRCGGAAPAWRWARRVLHKLLGREVGVEALLRPDYNATSEQSQAVATWLAANLVATLANKRVTFREVIERLSKLKTKVLNEGGRWPSFLISGLKVKL